jgi:aquaporin Z
VSIPIDGTSVNPARSLGVAWFGGSDALVQVWVFLLAPLVGAAIAGVSHAMIVGEAD